MALFELKQEYSGAEGAAPPLTFKDCAAADIDAAFFEQDEHADWHTVDGKDALVIVDDQRLKEHSDYGPKPKVGKHLVLDKGTNRQRSYTILNCEEEAGVYRISMERTRQ